MYNETMFISRNPVDEKYTSSDSKLAIYIVGEDTYIIYNGSLSSSTYTGELVDGGSIEFDGVTYDVNGSSLLPKSQTPDVDNPSTGEDEEEKEDKPTEFSLYGTWKDGNGNVVIFNDDGTGSWDGYEFTYDEETGVISSISGTAFVSEYNEFKVNDNGTLEIFVSDEYYENCYRGTFSKVESNGQNIYGTYRDGNTNTLVLNNDGTGTWNGYEFTYNEETGAMSSFGAFDSDKNKITVNDNGTLTVFVSDSYDENIYTGTFVKQ